MVVVSIYLVVMPFKSSPVGCSIALVVILLGIPVYFLFVRYKYLPDCFFNGIGGCTLLITWSFMQMLLVLCFQCNCNFLHKWPIVYAEVIEKNQLIVTR